MYAEWVERLDKRTLRRGGVRLIRLQVYKECIDCDWFANPEKCSEYEICGYCPNGINGECACCAEIPENEIKCPYFKEKSR